jgi:hypothetical protein
MSITSTEYAIILNLDKLKSFIDILTIAGSTIEVDAVAKPADRKGIRKNGRLTILQCGY